MSQKVRKTLIMIVMAALIICLMAASLTYTFTYGRYAGGKFDSENSPYEDLIEFVGAREYTVRSPEELIQAIEDGYSNIKIADDAEEPFVITEGVTDVEANLVLNLNGKVVVRNSRNPMLDVQTNVSVVLVYDSKNTGAFYNPVGSSLMASGGSLTVGSGGYESGPRADEYEGKESAGGKLGEAANATLFARSDEENNAVTGPNNLTGSNNLTRADYVSGYSLVSGVSLPTITPKTTQENGRTSVRGNVYLSSNHSDWLPADTFLVYTVEENCFIGNGQTSGGVTFTKNQLYVNAESEKVGNVTTVTASEFTKPLCNVASCDFYYYYPIDKEGNPIDTAGTADSPQDYAVIYGYWDVMALARDDGGAAKALTGNGLIWPYAAVRMVEGEGIVRGGTFSNHFDVAKSYGIYAEGGTLSVSKNTTVDTTFTTGGEGVCIRVQSATGETTTTGEATTTGGSLTISGGEFSSEIGNTIEMSGGKMNVTAGKFTKSAAKGIGSDGDDGNDGADQIANQTAIIDIEDGTLKIEGKSADSVKLTAEGTVTDNGGTDNGGTLENVFGIRAEGGTVTTSGCTFNISGDYSAGVLSYNGEINLGDDTSITVTQSETATVLTSAGVSSEQASGDGEHPVNLSGDVTITSNGLGITARGTVNVTGGVSTVTTSRGTGIYVNNGSFTVGSEAAITVNSTVKSGYSWANPPGNTATNTPNIYNGVYVQGGSLISNGKLNVTFTGVASDETEGSEAYLKHQIRSHAVRVEGDADTTVTIASGTILNGAQSDLIRDEGGNITEISEHNGVGGGILVNGGTVYLGATVSLDNSENIVATAVNNPVSVTTTGTENHGWNGKDFPTADGEPRNNWDYKVTKTGGDAVKVVNGQLTVYGGSYTSSQGNGIAIQQTTDGTATATVYGGTFSGDDVYSVNSQNSSFYTGPGASYAFKVLGGTLTIFDGIFTSNDGGAFVMNGTAKMYGGIIAAQGATAFVTYTNATVTFDPTTELTVDGVPLTGRTLYVSGASSGLTVEETSGKAQVITINGGTFTGGTYSFTAEGQEYPVQGSGSSRNGIWYGNGNATLKITGGTFQGENVSGLYFKVAPNASQDAPNRSNVQLSGGTYRGAGGAINATSPGNISTENICWGVDDNGNRISSWLYEDEALNNPITYEVYHLFAENEYYHIGGEYSIDLDGYLSSLTVASSRGQLNQKSSITISTQRSSGDYYQ